MDFKESRIISGKEIIVKKPEEDCANEQDCACDSAD